ncbi:glycosyltransferase family 2 protein [Candidatus Solirubrobacter pratensis]|uniref:glycosyltransferase family 2 protein n=1 Tax=Candidatus Solirubrobacter pratensis TaxID=1298857 RepID=UPI0003FDB570|nr:glycosyltransferase family A protein [Candidatus Solirubrobacter pratensis]
MKVSVIVPVYDPGRHFDQCLESLLGQTLPPADYELIFVDDGSTDGTGERLDALAATERRVRVEHIPNSGWPGRPRNVGLELAAGEFVHFVDNDDWIGPQALERLHAAAVAGEADIVVGKVVGHGRWLPRGMFVRDAHGLTAGEAPFGLLTPHKLFRRALLEEHEIRFPDAPRPLEDHPFVVEAYFRARRISILADYPCYHWMHRGRDTNASFKPPDPPAYFAAVREVLDLVDAHTEPGELRDRLYMRWYRGKLLGRLNGRQFARNDDAYMAAVLREARLLLDTRVPERLDAGLSYRDRLRARLTRTGELAALRALGAFELHVRAGVRSRRARRRGGAVHVELDATLGAAGFLRDGDRLLWRLPEAIAEALGEHAADVTDAMTQARVQLLLVSDDDVEYEQPVEVRALPPAPGGAPRLTASARLDPATAAAGAPLAPGRWKVRANVSFGGFAHLATVLRGGDPLYVAVNAEGRATIWPSTPRRLARRVPGLPAALRRLRRLRGQPLGRATA